MMQGFDALLAQEQATSQRQSDAPFVFKAARKWVEQLPDDVVLETATVKVP
jgi:hypothetical protein